MQPTASDSDKEKKQRGQSTVEHKIEFNSRKHVLEILHKPGI